MLIYIFFGIIYHSNSGLEVLFMYKDINFTDLSKELLEQLAKGAFLTVKSEGKVNTMTIAWGSLGFMWYKPVFTAMVRYSRHTYDLIEKSEDFTVSFPLKGQLKKELGLCGTKSGREIDKIKEYGLTLRDGETIGTPVIDDCDLHLECKIVFKQPMDDSFINEEVRNKAYPQGDYHVLYYGEIKKIYVKE
jgi:flavin reductase (DIM6/NTAB) family NADH-FMN oxidoreductase RutF